MYKGTITFLFDSTELFEENHLIQAATVEEAFKRLRDIAGARSLLLANHARIVKLIMKGHPPERTSLRGTGGTSRGVPGEEVILHRNDQRYNQGLRGVPSEIFTGRVLGAKGVDALRDLNSVLRESNCVVMRRGLAELIGEITFWSTHATKVMKKPTKTKLQDVLGAEEGERVYRERVRAERARVEHRNAAVSRARAAAQAASSAPFA